MARNINRNLAKLFHQKQQNLFCDVTLVATSDGTGIRAHRCVLHTASKYFEDMKNWNRDEIKVHGVSGAVLSQLIDYAYTEQIHIDASNVDRILAAAFAFKFDDVVRICENVCAATIDATNVFQFLTTAEKYRLNGLETGARTFAHEKFLQLIGSEPYLGLEAGTLFRLLEGDQLQIDREEDVFNAIVRWIEADSEVRKENYAALMQTVRMSKISGNFLNGRILKWSRQIGMEQVFIDACSTKHRQQINLTEVEREQQFKYMYTAGNLQPDFVDEPLQLERYSIASRTWEAILTFDGEGMWHIHCLSDYIYMIGHDWQQINQVKRIALATMEVEDRKSMQNGRFSFASVAVGRYIYCIGGSEDDVPIQSVMRYDTINDVWVNIGMLHETHCSADAVVLAGKIYVVGGYTFDSLYPLSSVERYDTETNRWTKVAELNEARACHRSCTIKGFIYAVGGCNSRHEAIASIERYDAKLDRWTIILYGLDVPRSDFGMGVCGNWIYIAGGSSNDEDGEYLGIFVRINVTDGQIEPLPSTNHEMENVCCVMTR